MIEYYRLLYRNLRNWDISEESKQTVYTIQTCFDVDMNFFLDFIYINKTTAIVTIVTYLFITKSVRLNLVNPN